MSNFVTKWIANLWKSKKEIIKAIIIILLLSSGVALSVSLRFAGLDGISIFIIASLVEIVAFFGLIVFGKRGLIYVELKEEPASLAGKETRPIKYFIDKVNTHKRKKEKADKRVLSLQKVSTKSMKTEEKKIHAAQLEKYRTKAQKEEGLINKWQRLYREAKKAK